MRDIFKEIKELEKNSEKNEKDAKYNKDRYETLRDEVKVKLEIIDTAVSELFDLMSMKKGNVTGRKRRNSSSDCLPVAESLYKKMLIDEKEVGTVEMERELEKHDLHTGNSNTLKVRNFIREMDCVSERRDGMNIILFCDKDAEDIKQKRLEFAKQIGPLSEKLNKEKLGDIDFVSLDEDTKIKKNTKFSRMG